MNTLSGKFFIGVNYWASKSNINMWKNYSEDEIENDFRLLSEIGITHLRVFPLWPDFQPLTSMYNIRGVCEYRFGEEPRPNTEAGKAGVSEEACRHFEHFCKTAEKYGLKLVVALITGQMSVRVFVPTPFESTNIIKDPVATKWAVRFVKYFVNRFKNEKSIVAWDLGNEVNTLAIGGDCDPDVFHNWCSNISGAVKSVDTSRPLMTGFMNSSNVETGIANLCEISDYCDMHTTHSYPCFSAPTEPICSQKAILELPFGVRKGRDISGVPTLIQETGANARSICSLKTEADFIRCTLYASLAHNCLGYMWWCGFDEGSLRYAPYDWNSNGCEYGLFTEDLKAKPSAIEVKKFSELLKKLPENGLPEYKIDTTVVVSKDNGNVNTDLYRATYVLAKRANMDIRFAYCEHPLPDTPVYIVPLTHGGHSSISSTRLDELYARAEKGATVYFSLDMGRFRDVPKNFGIDIAYRCHADKNRTLVIDGKELPVVTNEEFYLENINSQIIGTDTENIPLFFKHKIGKGYIFLSLVPIEKFLSVKQGAFYNEDEPEYDIIYRKLSEAAGIKRVIDCSSPFIRFTEHPINEKEGYIVAINYSPKPVSSKISTLAEITDFLSGKPLSNNITLKENDGIILKYRI